MISKGLPPSLDCEIPEGKDYVLIVLVIPGSNHINHLTIK